MALGRVSVDGMLAEMTAREFVEWQEWYRRDPFGEQREDMRSAMLASVLANIHCKGRHAIREFMLFPEERVYRQSLEEQRAIMRGLAGALSHADNR